MKRTSAYYKPKKSVWLTSFLDMMTIILVLFILIYSFSIVDQRKMDALVHSFNQQGMFSAGARQEPSPSYTPLDEETKEKLEEVLAQEENIKKLLAFVEQFSGDNRIEIKASYTTGGLELNLPEALLFESGEAVILPAAQRFLDQLAPLLKEIPNEIKVEGHTDNVPIFSAQYPTNWELSTARSTAVVRYLTDKFGLDPKRFVVLGYSENRPIASNDTEAGRSENRRVVVVISNTNE